MIHLSEYGCYNRPPQIQNCRSFLCMRPRLVPPQRLSAAEPSPPTWRLNPCKNAPSANSHLIFYRNQSFEDGGHRKRFPLFFPPSSLGCTSRSARTRLRLASGVLESTCPLIGNDSVSFQEGLVPLLRDIKERGTAPDKSWLSGDFNTDAQVQAHFSSLPF